ncbi:3393_t:CDS:2 [Cetraspora pellucida]|uniref:3393_t:CDS:1 n=1 Tax=Cetraspora pellucida TaxID=1433469 RepID=A0A9N9DNG7_9GLOM|nr:3393_t:CDS:2 [Cetraspora pellucida]
MIQFFTSFIVFVVFILEFTSSQVYDITVPNSIVRGNVLKITWEVINDNGMAYEMYWVSKDDPSNYGNIILLTAEEQARREYYWPVNILPGSYYISINNLESNTFIVIQKESDINNIYYGGYSYMCVINGEMPDNHDTPSDTPDTDTFDTPDDTSDNDSSYDDDSFQQDDFY